MHVITCMYAVGSEIHAGKCICHLYFDALTHDDVSVWPILMTMTFTWSCSSSGFYLVINMALAIRVYTCM